MILELLQTNGHKVDLTETLDRNSVELWVKGELVYKCNIIDLEFGEFTVSFSFTEAILHTLEHPK